MTGFLFAKEIVSTYAVSVSLHEEGWIGNLYSWWGRNQ
jgi:hypothetical protein